MTSKSASAQIISLEIQFGSVEFNANFEDYDPNGVLSVRAKVLNYPTIEINENDFCDDCSAQEETFSKGKHFLIPVPESKLKTLQEAFVINIKVMKTSLPEDLLPIMEPLGFTSVNIARTFATLLSKVDPATTRECPAIKLMSDQLEIVDVIAGAIIGTMNIYIRLKAFGKCIVTAMQDILGNKGQIFDKCFSSKDVVCDEDEEDMMCIPGVENAPLMQNNEFKELKAVSPDLDITVKVNKPVISDLNIPRNVSNGRTVKPGTIIMGKDNMVFNENLVDPADGPNNRDLKYEMKTGRVRPDDQTLQMTPVPDFSPTTTEGPMTGLLVDETADVYTLSVSKRNAKKNVYASVQMEVRVPKRLMPTKERFTRDVQYLATDVAPPAPAGKAKGKKKK